MAGFPLAINTISDAWTVPLDQSIKRLSKLGYRQFDVMVSPAHLDTENLTPPDIRGLRQLMADEGVQICSLTLQSLDHNLASPRAEIREMTLGFKRRILNLAAELDIPGVVLVSGRYNPLNPPPRANLERWLRESLERILPYAERVGVKFFLENIPMGVLPTAKLMMEWIAEFNSPALTVCYDVSNAHFINEDPAEGVRLVSSKLDLLHLSDTTSSAWKHDPIGTGTVDHAAVARVLKEIDFKGMSALEILLPNPDPVIVANHARLAKMGWEALRARP
jgi:L-ribulose-5-phosphate 3-epimerase